LGFLGLKLYHLATPAQATKKKINIIKNLLSGRERKVTIRREVVVVVVEAYKTTPFGAGGGPGGDFLQTFFPEKLSTH
jgi:hypothetical protein